MSQVVDMFTGASAYNFLVAKPNLSQTQGLLSFFAGVAHAYCAKSAVEQKQCCNVGMSPLKLSTHAKRSTLYASSHTFM